MTFSYVFKKSCAVSELSHFDRIAGKASFLSSSIPGISLDGMSCFWNLTTTGPSTARSFASKEFWIPSRVIEFIGTSENVSIPAALIPLSVNPLPLGKIQESDCFLTVDLKKSIQLYLLPI